MLVDFAARFLGDLLYRGSWHRGLCEDDREPVFPDVLHSGPDVLQPGLGYRADALQALYLEAVSPGEIIVGIVTGDDLALFSGQLFYPGESPLMSLLDLREVSFRGRGIACGIGRIGLLQGLADLRGAELPQLQVKPEMRVRIVSEQLVADELFFVDHLGDCGYVPVLAGGFSDAGEQVAHLALEMDAVVENEAGIVEALLVGAGRLVEMGVDARAAEAGDLNMVTSDDPRRICDHAGGADHVELAGGRGFFSWRAGAEEY